MQRKRRDITPKTYTDLTKRSKRNEDISETIQFPLPCSLPPSFPSPSHSSPSLTQILLRFLSPSFLLTSVPFAHPSPFLAHFFLPSLSSSFSPIQVPYLSFFLLLSLPIPYSRFPTVYHFLHPAFQETFEPTHFSPRFLFLTRQAVYSAFQMLILDSKQRQCAFPS